MGDRPTRFARNKTKPVLKFNIIDLVYDTVDIEWQLVPQRGDARVESKQSFGTPGDFALSGYRQPKFPQGIEYRALGRRHLPAFGFSEPVDVAGQRSARRDARIQLPDEARSGIAGIHEHLFFRDTLALVELGKVLAAHEDLSSHLEHGRGSLGLQPQRHAANRLHVGRDIFPDLAVSAGGGTNQYPFLVAQADGDAVVLEFGVVLYRSVLRAELEFAADSAVEGHSTTGLRIGLGANRQHRHGVRHFGQVGTHRTADPLRRRIGARQCRMLRFQCLQFPEQAVVFRIWNGGRVLDVVVKVGEFDLAAQLGGAGSFLGRDRHQENSRNASGLPASMPRCSMDA